MNTIWSKLSEEEKQEIIQKYKNSEFSTEKIILEDLFGKNNLDPKEYLVWEDIEKYNKTRADLYAPVFSELSTCNLLSKVLFRKLIATIQIAELIKLGYGGIVTDEEWKDPSNTIYVIVSWNDKLQRADTEDGTNDFIAFHTEEQRDKFLQYNEQLCKDYFMML